MVVQRHVVGRPACLRSELPIGVPSTAGSRTGNLRAAFGMRRRITVARMNDEGDGERIMASVSAVLLGLEAFVGSGSEPESPRWRLGGRAQP
jgi:hypothetical protein